MGLEQKTRTYRLETTDGRHISVANKPVITKNGSEKKESSGNVFTFEKGKEVLFRVSGTYFASALANYLRKKITEPDENTYATLPDNPTVEWLEQFNEYNFPEMKAQLVDMDEQRLKEKWQEIKSWHAKAFLELLKLPVFQEKKYLVLPHPRMEVQPKNLRKFIKKSEDDPKAQDGVAQLILERRIPEYLQNAHKKLHDNLTVKELYETETAEKRSIEKKIEALAGDDPERFAELKLAHLAEKSLYELNLLNGGSSWVKSKEELKKAIESFPLPVDENTQDIDSVLESLVGREETALSPNINIPDLLVIESNEKSEEALADLKRFLRVKYGLGEQPNLFADLDFVKKLAELANSDAKFNLAEIKTNNCQEIDQVEDLVNQGKKDLIYYTLAVGARVIYAYRRTQNPDFPAHHVAKDPIANALNELTTYAIGYKEDEKSGEKGAVVQPLITITDDKKGLVGSMLGYLIEQERLIRYRIFSALELDEIR